jgi:S-methylmethionine-dependent homocysteine/selenocysteine methylase
MTDRPIWSAAYARVKDALDNKQFIVLDGGTGTELQRRGVSMDPAAWCGPATLDNDELLTQIHLDYIVAGADVVTANTYASSRLMLTPAGYADQLVEINERAVVAALRARESGDSEEHVAVAGSLSHMIPFSAGTAAIDTHHGLSEAQMSDAFHELAHILKGAGVDHLMLEMMYNPVRIPLAVEAALSTGLPVWFGLSARRGTDGSLLSFEQLVDIPLQTIVELIPTAGIDAAGVMHTTSETVSDALELVRSNFGGPLMAYPDSGHFEMPDWRFVDTISPARLHDYFNEWIGHGAHILGGCCGLTIEHIEAAWEVAKNA